MLGCVCTTSFRIWRIVCCNDTTHPTFLWSWLKLHKTQTQILHPPIKTFTNAHNLNHACTKSIFCVSSTVWTSYHRLRSHSSQFLSLQNSCVVCLVVTSPVSTILSAHMKASYVLLKLALKMKDCTDYTAAAILCNWNALKKLHILCVFFFPRFFPRDFLWTSNLILYKWDKSFITCCESELYLGFSLFPP